MPAQRVRRVQDAIHGLMEFRGLETAVIDALSTRELQRLRRIRQLGLAHLVFPAAEHSRLAHAIGAAHLAIRFLRRLEDVSQDVLGSSLRPDQEVRRDMALAAACHDIGHGPLSHAWEEVMREDFESNRAEWVKSLGLDGVEVRTKIRWHELVGQALLHWPEGELHKLLENHEKGSADRIRRLLAGDYYLPYLPRLLDGDVDVDRCDYLIRDAHMTGVAYGRYDIDWLISTAQVGIDENSDKLVTGFDARKSVRVLEQFLVARRALYDTVYQHKTVRSVEGMVVKLLERLRDVHGGARWPYGKDLAAYRPVIERQPLTCEQVLGLDDYSLWVLIMRVAERGPDETAQDLAQRILRRDLFKLVNVDVDRVQAYLKRTTWAKTLASVIAPYCPGEASYYLYADERPFKTWNVEADKGAYLIDLTPGRLGSATRAYVNDDLKNVDLGTGEQPRRLFVPRDAVAAVRAELMPA